MSEALQKQPNSNQEAKASPSPQQQALPVATDIAAIQPTLCTSMEEEKHAAPSQASPYRDDVAPHRVGGATTTRLAAHDLINKDTEISLRTSLDMETFEEHIFKPLGDTFKTPELLEMIKKAHQLRPQQDFQLCEKVSQSLTPIDAQILPQELLRYDKDDFLMVLVNERFTDEKTITEQKSQRAANKDQPTNLERQIKLDPKLSFAQKESAIKDILKEQFPDIVKDKIGGQKYKCFSSKCRKTFQHLKQLFEHQKIHLKNYRPFDCDFPECKKSFMSKGHLRNHAETHQERKNFVCPIQGCNESYSRQQRLKVHLKKHNGNRDFVCPFENCQKAFYEKGNLKTHLRLHTGEKPYHCSAVGCKKSFATQGHLNDHYLKTHQLNQGAAGVGADGEGEGFRVVTVTTNLEGSQAFNQNVCQQHGAISFESTHLHKQTMQKANQAETSECECKTTPLQPGTRVSASLHGMAAAIGSKLPSGTQKPVVSGGHVHAGVTTKSATVVVKTTAASDPQTQRKTAAAAFATTTSPLQIMQAQMSEQAPAQGSAGAQANTNGTGNTVVGASSQSNGCNSNLANLSSGLAEQYMVTGIQMQMYNQIELTDINQNQDLVQNGANMPSKPSDIAAEAQRGANTLKKMQQSMGPALTRESRGKVTIGTAKAYETGNQGCQAMPVSATLKKKHSLKINIKAANQVADEFKFYNLETNSVPKPIDAQSTDMRAELENKSMMHENLSVGSAGKNDLAVDYLPFFFSFKDYEQKTGQKRNGAQTCIKVENRTLNAPVLMKANPEVHLDSQSQSQQSKVNGTEQNISDTGTSQLLSQAFGLQPMKSKSEFVPPPAKTPLNPGQLAKRRFVFKHAQQSGDCDTEKADEQRKQNDKGEEDRAQTFSQALKPNNITMHFRSSGMQSVEENASLNHATVTNPLRSNSIVSGSGTFAPNQFKGSQTTMNAVHKPMSISQTSNQPQLPLDVANSSQGPDARWKKCSPSVSKEKVSDTSNILTLKDLQMASQGHEKDSFNLGQADGKGGKKGSLYEFLVPQEKVKERPTLLSQLPYAQATATAVKKPENSHSFFGPAPVTQAMGVGQPFSCQKLPERSEPAFFNLQAMQASESKQTPQIFEHESSLNMNHDLKKSLNSVLEHQNRNQMMTSMQMLSNSSVCSNMQLTPVASQNASQTQKSFNFMQPSLKQNSGNQILASPHISANSNMAQQLLLQQQLNALNSGGSAIKNHMQAQMNNQSSSGSKGVGLQNQQRISSSLTDRTPSSIRWDKSQLSVSPISQNLSNPSMFFSHTGGGGGQSNAVQALQNYQTSTSINNNPQHQFKSPLQQQMMAQNTVGSQSMLQKQTGLPLSQLQAHSSPGGRNTNSGSINNLNNVSKDNQQASGGAQQTRSIQVNTNLCVNNHHDIALVQVDGQALLQQHTLQQQNKDGLQNSNNIANLRHGATSKNLNTPQVQALRNNSNELVDQNVTMVSQSNGKKMHNQGGGPSPKQQTVQPQHYPQLQSVGQQTSERGTPRDTSQTMMQEQQRSSYDPQQSAKTPKGLKMGGLNEETKYGPEERLHQQSHQLQQKITSPCDLKAQQAKQHMPIDPKYGKSTYKESVSSCTLSSFSLKQQQHQMELFRRKYHYQQKLNKIEYQLYVQNKLMSQQDKSQNSNFFFAQPVLPQEHFKMQAASQQGNPSMGMQIGSATNMIPQQPYSYSPWQQKQRQMMLQQAYSDTSKSPHMTGSTQSPFFVPNPSAATPSPGTAAAFFGNQQQQSLLKAQPYGSVQSPNPMQIPISLPDQMQYQQLLAENQMIQQQMQQQQNAATAAASQQQQIYQNMMDGFRNAAIGGHMGPNGLMLDGMSSSSPFSGSGPGTQPHNLFAMQAAQSIPSVGNSTCGFQQSSPTMRSQQNTATAINPTMMPTQQQHHVTMSAPSPGQNTIQNQHSHNKQSSATLSQSQQQFFYGKSQPQQIQQMSSQQPVTAPNMNASVDNINNNVQSNLPQSGSSFDSKRKHH